MVELPIWARETCRNNSPNPSMVLSNRGSRASGVLSRSEKPVPPVARTASTSGSAIHADTRARIRYTSSISIARRGERVSGPDEALAENVARGVVCLGARVRNG